MRVLRSYDVLLGGLLLVGCGDRTVDSPPTSTPSTHAGDAPSNGQPSPEECAAFLSGDRSAFAATVDDAEVEAEMARLGGCLYPDATTACEHWWTHLALAGVFGGGPFDAESLEPRRQEFLAACDTLPVEMRNCFNPAAADAEECTAAQFQLAAARARTIPASEYRIVASDPRCALIRDVAPGELIMSMSAHYWWATPGQIWALMIGCVSTPGAAPQSDCERSHRLMSAMPSMAEPTPEQRERYERRYLAACETLPARQQLCLTAYEIDHMEECAGAREALNATMQSIDPN